jgi:predicted membrane protein
MTQMIKNVTAFMGFGFVAFMHLYFVLILLAKPALAEEKAQKVVVETTAAVEDSEEEKMVLKNVASKQFKFKINDEEGSIRIDKNGIQISKVESGDGENGDDVATVVSSFKNLNKTNEWADILEDVLVPIVLFLSAFGFAGYYVYAKSRTRRDYLDTIKALAQSGQPIPPELLANMNATVGGGKTPSAGQTPYDANTMQGVKYIFWGIGIAGMMTLISNGNIAYAIGFLFIMMGAFHIYTSQMMQKQKATDTTAATTSEIKTP